MRILGHGVDMVETARIARMIDDHGEHFLARCFTESERGYAADKKRMIEHFAGRFAAKEAILKVLGTGWRDGIAWTDAEVVREPSGRPIVRLHGKCREVAEQLGIDEWWISISHIETHAIASAIGVGSG